MNIRTTIKKYTKPTKRKIRDTMKRLARRIYNFPLFLQWNMTKTTLKKINLEEKFRPRYEKRHLQNRQTLLHNLEENIKNKERELEYTKKNIKTIKNKRIPAQRLYNELMENRRTLAELKTISNFRLS